MRPEGKRSPLSIRPRCDEATPDLADNSWSVSDVITLRCLSVLPKSFLPSVIPRLLLLEESLLLVRGGPVKEFTVGAGLAFHTFSSYPGISFKAVSPIRMHN